MWLRTEKCCFKACLFKVTFFDKKVALKPPCLRQPFSFLGLCVFTLLHGLGQSRQKTKVIPKIKHWKQATTNKSKLKIRNETKTETNYWNTEQVVIAEIGKSINRTTTFESVNDLTSNLETYKSRIWKQQLWHRT